MITKVLDDSSITVIAEDSDDLLNLRRVLRPGDQIVAETTRVIKQDRDFSRPDRGERVRIRIVLDLEKVGLDQVLDRLRCSGVISESNNESVPHGSHHSLVVKIDEPVKIIKKRWSTFEKKLVASTQENFGFILIGIDTSDAGIGRLKGTHLQIMPNIYSGSGGKRYKTSFNIEKFFEEVESALTNSVKQNDKIIIFGPGETKRKFYNYLQRKAVWQKFETKTVDGVDSSGEDGLYSFTKSSAMKEIMEKTKIGQVANIIDEIMILASKKSKKFTMGLEDTENANEYGAIDSLVFSDKAIQNYDEERVISLLNNAEEKGVKTFSVDSSTDLGLRVTSLGGVVSLLRFAIDPS